MINSYNYLISSDYYKPQVKYNTHKKNELKHIYKDIMSISKDSPLYMFKLTSADQTFALSIKNYAGDIQSSLAQFTDTANVFSKSVLSSSDERYVQVSGDAGNDFSDLDITVNSLSVNQKNVGNALYTTASVLSAGTYKFGITINDEQYEYEYKVGERADNHTILTQLSDFINKTNIGIDTSLGYTDNASRVHLILNSNDSQMLEDSNLAFEIYDTNTVNGRGIVDYFGLDKVTTYPQNSDFTINDVHYNTRNNRIELIDGSTIELKAPTTEPVRISPAPDSSYVLDAVQSLADDYNSFIDFTKSSNISGNGPDRITAFMKSAISSMKNELEACGITATFDGHLQLDPALIRQAALDGSLKEAFTSDNGFANQLKSRTELIGINPMEYINKTIVTYPNSARPGIANPYLTSVYSGMLFNQYC